MMRRQETLMADSNNIFDKDATFSTELKYIALKHCIVLFVIIENKCPDYYI